MAKLKICGLTCKEDIEAVNGAKPDFAGFIIEVPGRRRSLTAEQVKVLVKGLDKEILPVGVFVNAAPELPISLLRDGTYGQPSFTGMKTKTISKKIQNMTGKPVIKAFSIKTPEDVQRALRSPCRLHPLRPGRRRNRRTFRLDPGSPSPSPILPCRRNRSRKPPQRHRNLTPMGCRPSSSLETDGRKDRAKIQQIARMLKQINTLEAYRKEREADLE